MPDRQRELAYMQRLQEAPWQVQVCKLADIFDNLMDIPHLPAERRGHAVARAEQYLAVLRHTAASEVKPTIVFVEQLLAEVKK
jgi:hypothetical protein